MSPRSVYLPETETNSQNSNLSETDPLNGLTQIRVAKTRTEFEAEGHQNDSEELISSQTWEVDASSGQTTVSQEPRMTFGQIHQTSLQELCLASGQDVTPNSDASSNPTIGHGCLEQSVRSTTDRQCFPLTPFSTSKPNNFDPVEGEGMEDLQPSANASEDEELCSPPTPQNFPLTQFVRFRSETDDHMELDRSQNNFVKSQNVVASNVEMDVEAQAEPRLNQEVETEKSDDRNLVDPSSTSDLDEQSYGTDHSTPSGFHFMIFFLIGGNSFNLFIMYY